MISQICHKCGWHFFKFSGRLLFIAALLLGSVPATAAAEEAISEAKTAPCKGLKPYNNLDELLYQFYINMESDCLFEMPTEELEKIWGITIYSYDKSNSERYFFNKLKEEAASSSSTPRPHKPEKEDFFVVVTQSKENQTTAFEIRIAENYKEQHGAFFPDGNFPSFHPQPEKKMTTHMVGVSFDKAYKDSLKFKNNVPDVPVFDSNWNIINEMDFEPDEERLPSDIYQSFFGNLIYYILYNSRKTHRIIYEKTTISYYK